MGSAGGGVTSIFLRTGLEVFFDESFHIYRNHSALHKERISQNTGTYQRIREILQRKAPALRAEGSYAEGKEY